MKAIMVGNQISLEWLDSHEDKLNDNISWDDEGTIKKGNEPHILIETTHLTIRVPESFVRIISERL